MASWASIARKDAQASTVQQVDWKTDKPQVAVVDANAIISGLRLADGAQRAVTIQDVMNEIRDKKSREWLQQLPYKIDIMEPSEQSVKTVTAFARMTGDLRNLSKPDIHLLALAHDLEVRVYGDNHLRKEPQRARVVAKTRSRAKPLPGWGAEGGEWAELDALDGLTSDPAVVSKIADGLSELTVGKDGATVEDGGDIEGQQQSLEGRSVEDQAQDVGDAEDWEVVAKSNTARRHRIQKQAKRAQRKVAEEEDTAMEEVAIDDADENDEDEEESGGSAEEEGGAIEMEAHPDGDSCISSVTADFAMQNVLLQMGLRLVTPDGRRIKEVNCWVLRCSACRATTREMQKLFCPQCGNATLDKVELTIGPDGQEQFGVRKKHNLRGTRYSLPKPKGGKKSVDPVLREDVMMAKMSRRRAKTAPEDHGWMTEFGGVQHQQTHGSAGLQKGLAPLINSWKNNPNERSHRGSNRRRK